MIPLSLFSVRLVNSKFKPPYQITDNLTFSPSLLRESSAVSIRSSCSATTMTSADFLTHRKRIYSKISPGKSFPLPPMPAASTSKQLCIVDVTMMRCTELAEVCLLILVSMPHMPFLFVSTGFCRLASLLPTVVIFAALRLSVWVAPSHRSAELTPKPCHLLMLQDVTPAHKGLTPSGKITPIFCLVKVYLYF
jgi:hypothetical protein